MACYNQSSASSILYTDHIFHNMASGFTCMPSLYDSKLVFLGLLKVTAVDSVLPILRHMCICDVTLSAHQIHTSHSLDCHFIGP
jgi:hypothetical protein